MFINNLISGAKELVVSQVSSAKFFIEECVLKNLVSRVDEFVNPKSSPNPFFVKDEAECESLGLKPSSLDPVLAVGCALTAVHCTWQMLKSLRQGEIKKACMWTLMGGLSGATAAHFLSEGLRKENAIHCCIYDCYKNGCTTYWTFSKCEPYSYINRDCVNKSFPCSVWPMLSFSMAGEWKGPPFGF